MQTKIPSPSPSTGLIVGSIYIQPLGLRLKSVLFSEALILSEYSIHFLPYLKLEASGAIKWIESWVMIRSKLLRSKSMLETDWTCIVSSRDRAVCFSVNKFLWTHTATKPSHKNGDENEKATTFTRLPPIFTMEVFRLMHKWNRDDMVDTNDTESRMHI